MLYATLAVVIVLLLLTYRSPVLWVLPILSAGVALTVAQAVIYLLTQHASLTVNGQSEGTSLLLAIGALGLAVHAIGGAEAKVGGGTAINQDVQSAAAHDRDLLIPLILGVVFLILGVLLRAIVAPLVLIATVVLSFAAALGTRRGAMAGLAATGGVITSAGLVLAGTFAMLGTLPLVEFTEIGFAVALGVLRDTIIVRSVLVTALTLDIGRHVWWPSTLARPEQSLQANPESRALTGAT